MPYSRNCPQALSAALLPRGASRCFNSREQTPLGSSCVIDVGGWRLTSRVNPSDGMRNPENQAICECILPICTKVHVDLTEHFSVAPTSSEVFWVNNPLYHLNEYARKRIECHEWLNDEIVTASQSVILQHFPPTSGLEPALRQETSFQVHREDEFVQILHVGGNLWCTVANIDCEHGVVNVYDSMYASVSKATVRVIASLLYCMTPNLRIRLMDVEPQKNGAHCGVLSIAYAYDICSGMDPCKVIYDHRSIRSHLFGRLQTLTFSSIT